MTRFGLTHCALCGDPLPNGCPRAICNACFDEDPLDPCGPPRRRCRKCDDRLGPHDTHDECNSCRNGLPTQEQPS